MLGLRGHLGQLAVLPVELALKLEHGQCRHMKRTGDQPVVEIILKRSKSIVERVLQVKNI